MSPAGQMWKSKPRFFLRLSHPGDSFCGYRENLKFSLRIKKV